MSGRKITQLWNVLSPDGFTITRDTQYATEEEAWAAFEQWRERYREQGYYSTVYDGVRFHVPLDELHEYCEFIQQEPYEYAN